MTGRARAWSGRLLLFRLADRRLDAALTLAVAGLLIWSRFGLLAAGPWEWDEVIFARGILDFNLAAHFPHPPGFPGWLAIGHLLLPLAGEPLQALQWASAALSVVVLWPLAALGRRVAAPHTAVAAALLVLLAPGPWLHAVRGFSSTPAAALAIAAAALAVAGVQGWRATAFTVLVAAAFLIRPILLPPLGVLWLAGAAAVSPRRRLLPGVAIGAALIAVSAWLMASAEGGWGALAQAFLQHGSKHFSRLASNPEGWSRLGLLKGLGGVGWGLTLLGLSAVGAAVWARRVGRRSALAFAAVLAVLVAQLVAVQNRSYPRYAVPAQLALAPLLAGAAALLPPAAATTAIGLGAAAIAVSSYPLLAEQHARLSPGYEAVVRAADEALARGAAVVVEPELYPFASYHWHVLAREGRPAPPLVLSPWAPEPWAGVAGPWLVATVHRGLYPDPLAGGELHWGGVSPGLRRLTQDRFLDAWLLDAPPLPLAGFWAAEVEPAGGRFMWGGAGAELLLPPLPAGTGVTVGLRPAPGPEPLTVTVNGRPVVELAGAGGAHRLWIEPGRWLARAPNRLRFERACGYPPGTSDRRPLAVQLYGVAVQGPAVPWSLTFGDGDGAGAPEGWLRGSYRPERFANGVGGVWLAPEARLDLPAGPGRLVLTMSAPRPLDPRAEIRFGGTATARHLELAPTPREVVLEVGDSDRAGGVVAVEVVSVPYTPAAAGDGADRRRLGVVLHAVRFEPASRPRWARQLEAGTTGRP